MPNVPPAYSDADIGDMKRPVSGHEFHSKHDKAGKAEEVVAKSDLDKLSGARLLQLLEDLQGGQEMTGLETGIDFMFAHSYTESIAMVKAAIKRKK